MAIERAYNIPLRKYFRNAPRYKRAKKAVSVLRIFLSKHMKSDNILIGKHLNLHLWSKGIKNPPHHVKVTVTKDDNGVVRAELEGYKIKEAKIKAAKIKKGKKTVNVEGNAEKTEKTLTQKTSAPPAAPVVGSAAKTDDKAKQTPKQMPKEISKQVPNPPHLSHPETKTKAEAKSHTEVNSKSESKPKKEHKEKAAEPVA